MHSESSNNHGTTKMENISIDASLPNLSAAALMPYGRMKVLHKFTCGRHRSPCLLGHMWPMLILTYTIFLLPACLYFAQPDFATRSIWEKLAAILLLFITTISLSLTSFRDPGIVHANKREEKQYCTQVTNSAQVKQTAPEVRHRAFITGDSSTIHDASYSTKEEFSVLASQLSANQTKLFDLESASASHSHNLYPMQFCEICEQFRPENAEHCDFIGRCIYEYDHFCPWVNNAIGQNNTSSFYTFLVSFALSMSLFFINGVISSITAPPDQNNGIVSLPETG